MPVFLETNREERFFCGVLMHVLLTNTPSSNKVLSLVNEATGRQLIADDLECYVEVAALRDAWRQLGDPAKYTDELHEARLAVLHELAIKACGFTGNLIAFKDAVQRDDLFWSSASHVKLVSPGRWPLTEIDASVVSVDPGSLRQLKWAFNAKPDILLISGGAGVLIEVKVVSGFGHSSTGYQQQTTQSLVASLIPVVTRGVISQPPALTSLTNKPVTGTLSWQQVAEAVDPNDVGAFSHQALHRAALVTT